MHIEDTLRHLQGYFARTRPTAQTVGAFLERRHVKTFRHLDTARGFALEAYFKYGLETYLSLSDHLAPNQIPAGPCLHGKGYFIQRGKLDALTFAELVGETRGMRTYTEIDELVIHDSGTPIIFEAKVGSVSNSTRPLKVQIAQEVCGQPPQYCLVRPGNIVYDSLPSRMGMGNREGIEALARSLMRTEPGRIYFVTVAPKPSQSS